MGSIPLQRDIVQRPGTSAESTGSQPVARTSLPGNLLAPAAARRFVAAALAEWSGLGLRQRWGSATGCPTTRR